jgi:hypothetical protein
MRRGARSQGTRLESVTRLTPALMPCEAKCQIPIKH